MAHLTLITGGQRSGKSSYAQKMALKQSTNPKYIATSRIWDEEHKQRIQRHQQDRGQEWINIEEEKHIHQYIKDKDVVLIDCVTLWLTNFFFDNNSHVEKSLEQAKAELERLLKIDAQIIMVSNEIGLGGTSENEIQRKFTDLQGWMNQHIATKANSVIMMVSGLPLSIK